MCHAGVGCVMWGRMGHGGVGHEGVGSVIIL